jgi:sugar lactone lactonase YvrE
VIWIVVAVVALAAAPLAAEAGAATAPPAAAKTSGTIIHPLPGPQVFPESVAVDAASGRYWVTSVKDGTLFTGVMGSAAPATVFSPAGADGRTIATGIAYAGGRLAVAGRQTGKAFVYDARSGRLIGRMRTGLPPERTWLNDVSFGANGDAYFTDSTAPVLWRARRTGGGYRLQRFLDFTGTPVRYRMASGAGGINVNGIAASAGGRDLVIGKRNDNALFHVDLRTKRVRRVALPAGAVTTPDGLVLRGRTLYVVQNTPSAVKVLRLSRDYTTAAVRGTITDPSFAFTTGAAVYRDRLLVVSSQFDTLGSPAAISGTEPPKLPFWVSEVAAGTR